MEIIPDTDTPSSAAYIVDNGEAVTLAHGNVATRMVYDKLERMSLDTFRRIELASMKPLDDNQLLVVNNATAGKVSLVYGDTVLRYTCSDVSDLPVSLFLESLISKQKGLVTPNLPWPLVGRYVGEGRITVTVKLAPTRRRFRNPTLGIDKWIWYPPLWFQVSMSNTFTPYRSSVAVVPTESYDCRETPLKSLCFPNVSSNGSICMGATETDAKPPVVNEATVIGMQMTLFFDGLFNNHLMIGGYSTVLGRNGDFRDIVTVLEHEDGWRKLRFQPLVGAGTEQFLCGGA